jgi:hypothetical protein
MKFITLDMILRLVGTPNGSLIQLLENFTIRISEMSVNIYHSTQHNIQEDSQLHTCYCEKLRSHHGKN